MTEKKVALQSSPKDILKSLAWFGVAIGLLITLIYFGPIISHGG